MAEAHEEVRKLRESRTQYRVLSTRVGYATSSSARTRTTTSDVVPTGPGIGP